MMYRIFNQLVVLMLPFVMGMTHPFYVSVTEVEYSSKTREIGIACKIFPDDLEETLRLFSKTKYDLSGAEKQKNNEALAAYFSKHLRLEINGKTQPLQFLGYENNRESTWVYFTAARVSGVKKMALITDILYEYKPEQTNIIHLNLDGKRESHRLSAPSTKVSIER